MHLATAKTRAVRRSESAGAVMFIVAMTLAVIAAMGVYALNIASTEVKTAGFVREQTQVHYLSEYGILGATQGTQLYVSILQNQQAARLQPDTGCISLWNVPSTASSQALACKRVGSAEMGGNWQPSATPIAPWQNNLSEATRGSEGLPTSPDFFVEFTDLAQKQAPPGFSLTNGCQFVGLTATSVGISQLTPGSYTSEGLETSRGRIIVLGQCAN